MWIVLGEERGRIKLVSKRGTKGLLPKGTFLTIENGPNKYILRVDNSQQTEPYSPAPLLADMDLSPISQDQKCQNILYAYRVKDLSDIEDGYIDFIPPQSLARIANQEEVTIALEAESTGPPVFIATLYAGKNQILRDEKSAPIKAHLPVDMFFHQMLVCGKTGSGKTVATKYLAQYFVEELKGYGAVLAINVKDVDFLKMDQKTTTVQDSVLNEWESLDISPHGIDNFTIYQPAISPPETGHGVTFDKYQTITLDVKTIDPDALSGLLQNISEIGSQHLPDIFRKWQEDQNMNDPDFTFAGFTRYFQRHQDSGYLFDTINSRGDELSVKLHSGTFTNISSELRYATEFFDNPTAQTITASDILEHGKMSVINVAGSKGIQFGSVILRHLLKDIVDSKSQGKSKVPILIIIDEVHQFYNTTSSKQALGDLDTICRTGRSQEIGVIFSSQNPSDIPRGLSSVINTKIFFKSDRAVAKNYGIEVSTEEMQSLKKGFAVANIHDLSQLKVMKFPLSLSGVFEKQR
jgi:uncharacterized protein